MLKRVRGPSSGFTLIELVVVLVVMAALTAIITPQVIGRLRGGEVGALSQNIITLAESVHRFRQDVGRYPDSIQHLVSLPTSASDVCGTPLPATFQAEWSGPYLNRAVNPTGIVSGSSVINRDVVRTPATSSAANPYGTLTLMIDGVDRATADGLEAAFDGNGTLTAGTIRWTVGSLPDRGRLFYDVPIRGC